MKTYQKFLKDPAQRSAFTAGALAMAKALGQPCPLEDKGSQETWVLGKIVACAEQARREAMNNAELLIATFNRGLYQQSAFRGMLFDCPAVDDNGIMLDQAGKQIEDDNYECYSGIERLRWANLAYVDRETGDIIPPNKHQRIPAFRRRSYRAARFLDIKDYSGKIVYRLYDDDTPMMDALIREDILGGGDMLARRYIVELGAQSQREAENQTILNYRHTILEALRDRFDANPHSLVKTMIIDQAANSYITMPGHYNLAILQMICVAMNYEAYPGYASASYLARFLGEDWEDESIFAHYFPDKAITSYRMVNGNELQGFIPASELSLLPSELDDQFSAEEALNARRSYVRYKLLPRAIERFRTITEQVEKHRNS